MRVAFALNITNAPAVRNAYHDIIETVQKRNPDAKLMAFRLNLFTPEWS